MSRLRIIMLALLAVCAVGAVASTSSASAFTSCYRVAEKGTGNKDSSCVTNEGGGKNEYINIEKLETKIKAGEWCAKVKEASTGNYEDNACTKKVAKKEFIKVKVPAYWLCNKTTESPIKEPPTKFDNHLCNTKEKALSEREWEWLPVEANYKIEGKSGLSKLESTLAGVRVSVECKKDSLTGEIGPNGTSSNLKISYKECALSQIVKYIKEPLSVCTVPEIKTTTLKDLLIEGKGAGPEDEFEPETGTVFAEFNVEGASCVLKRNNNKVEGKQICQLPEAPVGKVEHEIVCSPTGGPLTFEGEPASYFGSAEVKLENGWAWGAEP